MAVVVGLVSPSLCFGQLLGPTPYLSQLNSPFAADIVGGSVFLENFEDGSLNTPGVTASAGNVLAAGTGNTDSVDGDDGSIDGSGLAGRSLFFISGGIGISFTFNAAALPGGALPTRAGIVWTDGGNPVTFEAFDAGGVSLGTVTASHATPTSAAGPPRTASTASSTAAASPASTSAASPTPASRWTTSSTARRSPSRPPPPSCSRSPRPPPCARDAAPGTADRVAGDGFTQVLGSGSPPPPPLTSDLQPLLP